MCLPASTGDAVVSSLAVYVSGAAATTIKEQRNTRMTVESAPGSDGPGAHAHISPFESPELPRRCRDRPPLRPSSDGLLGPCVHTGACPAQAAVQRAPCAGFCPAASKLNLSP